ncbi:hypothetical protein HJD18_01875 [Thermoleophilia bacterium SCSIO 60948]|nr:hypothetical protein HJD18_01875 [Thermoleophilia bacterium SCSIO 60948]
MTFRLMRRALASAALLGIAIPATAGADWTAPKDLPSTRVEQVEATMSPQGNATVVAVGIAGPADVYTRAPARGSGFVQVLSAGPCVDVAECRVSLDAGAKKGWVMGYEGKYDENPGVSSTLTAFAAKATGALGVTDLAGPYGGVQRFAVQVAANGTNRAVAAWGDGSSLIAATKSGTSNQFGESRNLVEANAGPPDVAIGKDGTAVISARFGSDNLLGLRRAPGEDWVRTAPEIPGVDQISSAVNSKGKTWTLFTAEGATWFRVWRPAEADYVNKEVLCFGGEATSPPSVEIGPDDQPRVAFTNELGELRVSSLEGTCRVRPYVIGGEPVLDYSYDVRGKRAVLAWVQELPTSTPEDPRYVLRAKTGPVDGLKRAKTVRVTGNPDQVSASVDAKGNAIVAYRRNTEERELGAEVLSYRAPGL